MQNKPTIEIIWRESDLVQRKCLSWANRPQTTEAIEEYVHEYLSMVFEGYKPEGHKNPPVPYCCRIHHNGAVVAEWIEPARPNESLVTFARLRSAVASAGAVPSAPCLERLAVQRSVDPCH